MLKRCLWTTTLPWIVLSQTYYMNFVFNNNGYMKREQYETVRDEKKNSNWVDIDEETLEISSMTDYNGWASKESHDSASNTDEVTQVIVISHNDMPSRETTKIRKITTTTSTKVERTTGYNFDATEEPPQVVTHEKVPKEHNTERHTTKKKHTTTTVGHTTTKHTTAGIGKELQPIRQVDPTEKAQEVTTEANMLMDIIEDSGEGTDKNETTPEGGTTPITDGSSKEDTKWKTVTPHPPEFFQYPGAKCHEEMDLHELFGISLERDRGIPSKVLCEFNNSWGGPWHLMTRIELPSRVHMRHWFFGYITEDYKDMNINFLALAHIMNSMRIAMLIIGQDNNDQLVYNLYDDVVISGFNDLFMLRKAQLVAANTTDLLFVSVGDVITTFSGRNRSCPFRVIGGWWGFNLWRPTSQYFCVFPVDRDVQRPGYMAIFIKPSPFAVNNTAMYENVITTRRPWASTVDTRLMEQAGGNQMKYRKLKGEEFTTNKMTVLAELGRRADIYKDLEKARIMETEQPLGKV